MDVYFDQVNQAAHAKLYFLALAGALTIPDMCAGLESEDGKTNARLYAAWVEKHVSPKFTVGPNRTPSFSGLDCYGLRCSLLHQGRLAPHKGGYARIVFVEPITNAPTMHNNVINDALNIDVSIFSNTMVESAQQWLSATKNTPFFETNVEKYMKRYPNGIPPYITGIPVIA